MNVTPNGGMNQQILSQDEVDALLQGITDDEEAEAPAQVPAGGVRAVDLTAAERIVRSRMPALEIVNERFARNIRSGLFEVMRRSAEVSVGAVRVQKFSAFMREIVVPSNFNIVGVKPLRGAGLVVCDPSLVFAVIDALFGGAGSDWLHLVPFYEANLTLLIDWTSSDSSIASVTSQPIVDINDVSSGYYNSYSRGKVTGVATGTATVTATARLHNSGVTGGISDSSSVPGTQ